MNTVFAKIGIPLKAGLVSLVVMGITIFTIIYLAYRQAEEDRSRSFLQYNQNIFQNFTPLLEQATQKDRFEQIDQRISMRINTLVQEGGREGLLRASIVREGDATYLASSHYTVGNRINTTALELMKAVDPDTQIAVQNITLIENQTELDTVQVSKRLRVETPTGEDFLFIHLIYDRKVVEQLTSIDIKKLLLFGIILLLVSFFITFLNLSFVSINLRQLSAYLSKIVAGEKMGPLPKGTDELSGAFQALGKLEANMKDQGRLLKQIEQYKQELKQFNLEYTDGQSINAVVAMVQFPLYFALTSNNPKKIADINEKLLQMLTKTAEKYEASIESFGGELNTVIFRGEAQAENALHYASELIKRIGLFVSGNRLQSEHGLYLRIAIGKGSIFLQHLQWTKANTIIAGKTAFVLHELLKPARENQIVLTKQIKDMLAADTPLLPVQHENSFLGEPDLAYVLSSADTPDTLLNQGISQKSGAHSTPKKSELGITPKKENKNNTPQKPPVATKITPEDSEGSLSDILEATLEQQRL